MHWSYPDAHIGERDASQLSKRKILQLGRWLENFTKKSQRDRFEIFYFTSSLTSPETLELTHLILSYAFTFSATFWKLRWASSSKCEVVFSFLHIENAASKSFSTGSVIFMYLCWNSFSKCKMWGMAPSSKYCNITRFCKKRKYTCILHSVLGWCYHYTKKSFDLSIFIVERDLHSTLYNS